MAKMVMVMELLKVDLIKDLVKVVLIKDLVKVMIFVLINQCSHDQHDRDEGPWQGSYESGRLVMIEKGDAMGSHEDI